MQSFRADDAKRPISTDGGMEPAWSADGRKLTYLSPASGPAGDVYRLIEVDVAAGAGFSVGPARTSFELPVAHYPRAIGARGYDVTAGAERFLFVHETYPPAVTRPREMHLVQNWFEELRQRMR